MHALFWTGLSVILYAVIGLVLVSVHMGRVCQQRLKNHLRFVTPPELTIYSARGGYHRYAGRHRRGFVASSAGQALVESVATGTGNTPPWEWNLRP